MSLASPLSWALMLERQVSVKNYCRVCTFPLSLPNITNKQNYSYHQIIIASCHQYRKCQNNCVGHLSILFITLVSNIIIVITVTNYCMKNKQGIKPTLNNLIDYEELNQRRRLIQRIKENNLQRLQESKKQISEKSPSPRNSHGSPNAKTQQQTKVVVPRIKPHSPAKVVDKNANISDTDKMLFDKKFKNFLNHKQEYLDKARKNPNAKEEKKNNAKRNKPNLADAQYYNEEEVLSNTGSDYQYRDATDMQAAYDQMTTGKKRKGAQKQLFHCEYYQNQFRKGQFNALLERSSEEEQALQSITKDTFLNYLFDEPSVMMLYSINPYQLGDELAELQTKNNNILNYQQFSAYLLADREPTYFDYSHQNLIEARKLGRGIKCAPIIAKWVDQTGIYEFLLDIYRDIDMHGDGRVDKVFLAKKIRKQAQQRRITQVEVIQIVNINKKIPLNRLLYEIEYQERGQEPDWTFQEFQQFLTNYKRRATPQKDKLITKLILAGKYDSSYVYVISQEILQIVKQIFSQTPHFAQYFVRKEKLIQNICKDSRYKRIQSMNVRSQSNRYVKKETFEQTLIRMFAEGEEYLDIEEVLDFLTNRGRPKVVQYRVYIQNLERQLKIIEDQQRKRRQKYGDNYESSSDEEFNEKVRQKRIKRKQDKILQIRSSNTFSHDKKFNVTIPMPFAFDTRDKQKKVSIRQQKLQEMLEEKQRKLIESMQPFRSKQVPSFVKDNLYEKMLKDQQRERKQRLERFRLEIMSQVHVSDRLMMPKSTEIHCDFSSEEYKFVARPMPWYCEVNLLDRINRKKMERREKILQEIINRNADFDLPEGVQKMIERQDQLSQKRAAKRTASTGSVGDCTFAPKISHKIPDFKTIHEHLHFDLENAKNFYEPIKVEPFSFENRPAKSRTTYEKKQEGERNVRHSKYQKIQNHQDFTNIPKTQKFQALVELRRRQFEQKQKQIQKQKRSQAVRKLRQQKFAPIVRQALKSSDVDINKSRAIIADKIKEFKREEKKKKMDYENQMIKIYTKVFQRPLLVENGGVEASDKKQPKQKSPQKNVRQSNTKKSKHNKESKDNYLQDYYGKPHGEVHQQYINPHKMLNLQNDRRRVVENHHPGQYPLEDGDDEQYEDGFHESQLYEEQYEGNIHTS